jgi:hypothetical protein
MNRTASTTRTNRVIRRLSPPLALAVLAACSGGGSTTSDSTDSTTPTTTSSVATTTPAVVGGVTTTSTAEVDSDVVDFASALVLEPGRDYRIGETFVTTGTTMTFTAPDEEVHSYLVPGLAAMWADEFGKTSLVNVLAYANANTFSVTSPDPTELITVEAVQAIMTGTPSDPFEWMASRGYVELGPIEETTFAGHPARTTTYEFLEIEDGFACFPDDPRPCIWTFGSFDTSITYFPGERGTFVDVKVDGEPFLIDVRDQPGAAAIAESIEIATPTPASG